jgi:hypothetical protein
LELCRFIRAGPQVVWDVLADIQGQERWMVGLRELQITSGRQSGPGTEISLTSELFGLPVVKDALVITSWQPPHRYDVRHQGAFSGTGAFIVDEVPGGSVFTWIEEFKPPFGPLGELGFRLLIGPHLRRVFGRSMENVRQLAESPASLATGPASAQKAGSDA